MTRSRKMQLEIKLKLSRTTRVTSDTKVDFILNANQPFVHFFVGRWNRDSAAWNRIVHGAAEIHRRNTPCGVANGHSMNLRV